MEYNLNYIRILTDNFKEMYEFYSKILGMKPKFNEINGPYEEFSIKGATLSLFEKNLMELVLEKEKKTLKEPSETPHRQDKLVLIFAIPNVDEFYQEIKEKTNVVVEPMDRPDWRIRTVHLRDPDNNLLEFNQPL
jgi:catechol 2,3-dioxygenase-like lactoylglutathione lyase family enzyme